MTAAPSFAAAALAAVKIAVLGVKPYAALKVMTAWQVLVCVPVPEVMVNDPAESVEPAVILALGEVAQDVGVPIVGAVVCVELK